MRDTCADRLSGKGIQYCLGFKQAAVGHRLTQLLGFCSALALTPTFPSGPWYSSDGRLLVSHLSSAMVTALNTLLTLLMNLLLIQEVAPAHFSYISYNGVNDPGSHMIFSSNRH